MGGKAPLGIALLGPGIGEVEVNPVDLPLPEVLGDELRLAPHKEEVWKLQLFLLFYSPQKDAGVLLQADKTDTGILFCHLQKKPALARADLQPDGMVIAKQRLPAAPVRLGILDDKAALPDDVPCAGYIPKSQINALLLGCCVVYRYEYTIRSRIPEPDCKRKSGMLRWQSGKRS